MAGDPRPAVVGDLRPLPRRHRLGRRPTRTPRAVGWDGVAHRRFLNDFYSGALPGLVRARRAVPGRTRRPATRASPAPPRRCAGSRRRSGAGDEAALELRHPPAGAAARRRVRLRRGAARLHGRRARRCATTAPTADDPAPRATTTAGCTGRRWTGRRPRAATTPAPSRGGCSPRSSGCAARAELPPLHGGGRTTVVRAPCR